MIYYKTCENCADETRPGAIRTPDGDEWWCANCCRSGHPGLVPVAEGAIIIEDAEAAVERMARFEFKRSPWQGSAKITWESADKRERQKYLTWAAEVLRAAAGEKP